MLLLEWKYSANLPNLPFAYLNMRTGDDEILKARPMSHEDRYVIGREHAHRSIFDPRDFDALASEAHPKTIDAQQQQ